MAKKNNNGFKYFFMSMIISMMFFALIIGLIIVENNTGSIIFGHGEPFFEYNISENHKFIKFVFLGRIIEINFMNFVNYLINFITKICLDFPHVK